MKANNYKIEKLLGDLLAEKDKYAAAKEEVKEHTVDSIAVLELKAARTNLTAQIKAQTEKEMRERKKDNKEFIEAKDTEIKHKNRIKELIAQLREEMSKAELPGGVGSFMLKIEGEQHQIGVERHIDLYLNDKLLKAPK